ncbi:proprotein convertase subtilisin/kexin type 7 [Athene cunicularia]|uniref:proprotein convertase subtilisin/kexin type 7 n=1 Tax=Athene cunicularia TaxID=194338 RepID=UPI000EF6D6A2|nr:proprotein convertase subtilisin/kexin type 7 [Athene cunicularia]
MSQRQAIRRSVDTLFAQHDSVRWHSEQKLLKRSKRSLHFNDPKYPQQWHLNNRKSPGKDINVTGVWERNVTGRGVTVVVVDDGVEHTIKDIQPNYSPEGSYDLNSNDPDPMPHPDEENGNHHGTRCAGEIAAVPNNSFCTVGVAYGSRIAGIRVLDGPLTDSMEAIAFNKHYQINDIYSCSWGPDDDGKTVDGPHQLGKAALQHGVIAGRRGFGSIFVVASGNGGQHSDNCNYDGYANSIYTVTIGAVDETGSMPFYAEECASMLAVTFSGGDKMMRSIVSTTPGTCLALCSRNVWGAPPAQPRPGRHKTSFIPALCAPPQRGGSLGRDSVPVWAFLRRRGGLRGRRARSPLEKAPPRSARNQRRTQRIGGSQHAHTCDAAPVGNSHRAEAVVGHGRDLPGTAGAMVVAVLLVRLQHSCSAERSSGSGRELPPSAWGRGRARLVPGSYGPRSREGLIPRCLGLFLISFPSGPVPFAGGAAGGPAVTKLSCLSFQYEDRRAKWDTNQAGFRHSHQHGFGLLNAWRLVNAAKIWESVPYLASYVSPALKEGRSIPLLPRELEVSWNGKSRRPSWRRSWQPSRRAHTVTTPGFPASGAVGHPEQELQLVTGRGDVGTGSPKAQQREQGRSLRGSDKRSSSQSGEEAVLAFLTRCQQYQRRLRGQRGGRERWTERSVEP